MSINFQNLPKPLTEKEVKDLFKTKDEESKKKVVEHNLRLIVHIEKNLVKQFGIKDYDEEDLFQVGTIGLIKAVNKFDIEKGIKFATYATRCIQNEILMYLRKNNKHLANCSLYQPISIDNDGNELTVESIYSDDICLEEEYCEKEEVTILHELVNRCLTDKEKYIITLMYGLDGNEAHTQRQVADYFGISQSYISRIVKKAISKLNKAMQSLNNPKSIILPSSKPKEKIVIEKNNKKYQEITLTNQEQKELIKLSENPLSIETLTSMPSQNTLIISLISGYTGKYFTSKEIADYLKISEVEVTIIIKETLKILESLNKSSINKRVLSPKNTQINIS